MRINRHRNKAIVSLYESITKGASDYITINSLGRRLGLGSRVVGDSGNCHVSYDNTKTRGLVQSLLSEGLVEIKGRKIFLTDKLKEEYFKIIGGKNNG